MTIRPAQARDRSHVEALLRAAGLPLDGVAEHFEHFVVAEIAGVIVGAAGVELYGEHGLLRSVVVAGEHRRAGLGWELVQQTLRRAQAQRLHTVYLLTTTAEEYFSRRGFKPVQRDQVPAAVQRSREFVEACPASATAMCRSTASSPRSECDDGHSQK